MSKNFVSNEDANSLFSKVGDRLGLRPKTFTGTHDQWDQLTELQQSEYEYVNFTDDCDIASTVFTETLTAGDTTITITDQAISADSMIDIYTNVFGIAPTNIAASAGTVTVTFNAQQNDISVKIVVR